jgi:hypothetical protein
VFRDLFPELSFTDHLERLALGETPDGQVSRAEPAALEVEND